MSVDNMNPGGGANGTIVAIPDPKSFVAAGPQASVPMIVAGSPGSPASGVVQVYVKATPNGYGIFFKDSSGAETWATRLPKGQGTFGTVSAMPAPDGKTVFAGDFAYAASTGKVYQLLGSVWTPITDPLGVASPAAPLVLASDGRTLSMPLATATQDGYMGAGMVAQLNSATSGVASNLSAINALTTRVTTAEGSVAANSTAISGLQTRATTDEATIAANGTAIGALQSRVTTDEAAITALQNRPTLASLTIGTGTPMAYSGTYVLSMPAATASANGYMTSAFVGQLNAATAGVSSNSTAIAALQGNAATDEANIVALQSRATADETSIAAIKAKTDVLAPNGAIRVSKDVSVTALAVGALGTYSVSVPGALVGMVATVAPPVGLVPSLSSWSAAVTAKDSVTIKFAASAAILAGTQTFVILLQ